MGWWLLIFAAIRGFRWKVPQEAFTVYGAPWLPPEAEAAELDPDALLLLDDELPHAPIPTSAAPQHATTPMR